MSSYTEIIRDDFATRVRRPEPNVNTAPLKTAMEIGLSKMNGERTQVRHRVRERIAHGRLAKQQHEEIVNAMARCRANKETMADEHCEHCQPIQTSLTEIEAEQMRAIMQREPQDTKLEERRKQLLGQLRELNSRLEQAIEDEDRKLAQLEVERIAAAHKCPTSVDVSIADLIKLGSPKLLAVMKLAEFDWTTAEKRLDILREPLLCVSSEAIGAAEVEVVRTREAFYKSRDAVINE